MIARFLTIVDCRCGVNFARCVFILFFVCFSGLAAGSETGVQKRPNVILFLTDDQGYGDLSCHGNPVLKTPNMDKLWSESVRLTDFHVSPLCSPTRAGLMTGRYCRCVGVHGTNGTRQHLAEEAVTMADLFKSAGYATGIFGKWHLGDRYPLRPMDRGFTESVVHISGCITSVPDHWGNDYFDDVYVHNGTPKRYKGYCTDVWVEEALRFIETNKDRPFFCYLPTNAAHAPFLVPELYAKPYQNNPQVPNAAFYGMIANLDENLGRLRKRLAELELDRNTILVFMTDNGTVAGVKFKKNKKKRRGLNDLDVVAGFNAGMRGKKGSSYDGGHRVPCFVHWPDGGLVGGRDAVGLSANIDILPTLVDLCGLDLGKQEVAFNGISLKPLLDGSGTVDTDRILIESFRHCVMTKRWRLVNESELYDIEKDPGQRHNVAEQFPGVVAKLKHAFSEYRKTEDHRPHYIVIGSDQQNPVTLTCQDWKVRTPVFHYWLARSLGRNGVWNVKVARPGRYQFALRRWPRETNTAINAKLPKEKWAPMMTGSVAIDAVEARIRVGDIERRQEVTNATQEATFTLELDAGPTTIRTWFVEDDGSSQGAYYLYVRRLPDNQDS